MTFFRSDPGGFFYGVFMAATRIIPLHVNKGKTVAKCLSERADYYENEKKTENGKYISSYECDPKTCDKEFLLAKREYYFKGQKSMIGGKII